METSAVFSACRQYRYALWRRWAEGPQVLFVMLNSSTADESVDDPTIRRCIGLAKGWGFGSLAVGNLFAFRTPSPVTLKRTAAPVGELNDEWLHTLQPNAALTIAAWGNHGVFMGRSGVVRAMFPNLHTLGLTQLCEPRHQLYVSAASRPELWEVIYTKAQKSV